MSKVTISVDGGPPQTFDYTAGTAINVSSGSAGTEPSGTVVDRGSFPGVGNTKLETRLDGKGEAQAGTVQRYDLDLSNATTLGHDQASLEIGPSGAGLWKAWVQSQDANNPTQYPLTLGEYGRFAANQFGHANVSVGGDPRGAAMILPAGKYWVCVEIVASGHYSLEWNNQQA